MTWTDPDAPNIGDYMLFLENNVGIPADAIPAQTTWPQWSLNRGLDIVLQLPTVSALEYTIAVYNCSAHLFLKVTPDNPNMNVLAGYRKQFNMLNFAGGVVQSTADQGTSTGLSVPESLQHLTVGDLDFLKTPWGQAYIAYAQDFGSIAGLS